jgi:D-tyrosyl-tRNA(Tyr) deacylase
MELTPAAIGHILPKYQKENLTEEIVKQMIERTLEPVEFAIIDRSSLNTSQIEIIANGCSNYDVEVVKAKDIKYGKII